MQRRRLSTPFQLLRAAIVLAAWVSASVFSSSPSSSDNHDDDLEAVVVGGDVCIGENASSSVCVGEDAESTPFAAEHGSVDGRGDWTIPQKVYRICDPAVAGISAWLVLVITLEINDFRYHLKLAHTTAAADKNSNNKNNNRIRISYHPFIASLVAIRLGLRDALLDAAILYFLTYGIVFGLTREDADSNALLIIWGTSYIASASILAITGLKIPQWLGIYYRSNLQFLNDTSHRAHQAVHDHAVDCISSLETFRYQVRLGVGKHTTQFVLFLLPFYTDLKVLSFLSALFVGFLFGHVFLYAIFKCRQRYSKHREMVAMCASATLSLVSSFVFTAGVYIIDTVWNWHVALPIQLLGLISFMGWLTLFLILQGIRYYEQKQFASTHKTNKEESEEDEIVGHLIIDDDIPLIEVGKRARCAKTIPDSLFRNEDKTEGEMDACGLKDQLINELNRRVRTENSIYETVYFDSVAWAFSMKDYVRLLGETNSSPKEIYDAITAVEGSNHEIKWNHRFCRTIPPIWEIFIHSFCRNNSNVHTQPTYYKALRLVDKFLMMCINLTAIFVAVVACGATVEIRRTKAKLPAVRKILYAHQDDGPVCAFDKKCGNIREFASKEYAHSANYSIAHCGSCAFCSTWNDMEVQYSTRNNLAEKGQRCSVKALLGGYNDAVKCMEDEIGFNGDCARCWTDDFACTRKFCMFIFLQSNMNNQIANFNVSPHTITTATCEEANCEAGNPGDFVRCSGSNRRRMNIVSDIPRPAEEHCQIVDVDDWGSFFDVKCELKEVT